MKNPLISVSMEKIFNEHDDDILMTKNKPVHVTMNGDGKQIGENNDDSDVPLVETMIKHQPDVRGRALNLTDASSISNGKTVEMVNYVTTQSSDVAKGIEDLSDVSMDDDEANMHDMHSEDAKIDINECISNGKRYKVSFASNIIGDVI